MPDAEQEKHAAWQRWLVLLFATTGIVLALVSIPAIWLDPDATLRERLYDTITSATAIALLSICILIAWRAGESVANLAIALAITAIWFSDAFMVAVLWQGLHDTVAAEIFTTLTYIAGAGLFLRASQLFPERLTPAQVGNRVLTALLKPALMWPLVVALSVVAQVSAGTVVTMVAHVVIIGLGIAYFYKSYRMGDADVRRKVLWFLAMAIAAAVLSVVMWAVKLALGPNPPETLRLVVGITLFSLNSLSMIVCVLAAVFYAGAISPSLVIRKTVGFGLTTALLLFVFATVEVFLHHQIVHFLHVTDTFASSLIGGAFGLTFHPVKHYFEHLLQRFQGRH